MKHFILLFIFLASGLAVWADDVTIPLTTAQQESTANVGTGKDRRSLSFAPEASHDGSTVYIYSYDSMEEIQVAVLDEGGNVVYENTAIGSCSFTLGSGVQGELTLLVETKDAVYKGTFYLK